MDAATSGGSATDEFNIISHKFLVTPLKTGSGSLGGEYCDPCSSWLGGFGPGVVLIYLNALTVNERNESKYPSEIPTGTPSKSPADDSIFPWVESSCEIKLTNVKL